MKYHSSQGLNLKILYISKDLSRLKYSSPWKVLKIQLNTVQHRVLSPKGPKPVRLSLVQTFHHGGASAHDFMRERDTGKRGGKSSYLCGQNFKETEGLVYCLKYSLKQIMISKIWIFTTPLPSILYTAHYSNMLKKFSKTKRLWSSRCYYAMLYRV